MNKIDIIGLGAGDLDQLPLGMYRRLVQSNKLIYVRTLDHPAIASLEKEGVRFSSFDYMYEEEAGFSEVYERIVKKLLKNARLEPVIYAVPGHPLVAEKTVQLLLEQQECEISISGGQSYLDALFTSLQIDPIDGFQFVDGTQFDRSQLDYRNHLIFSQVYDSFIASEIKLTLLEDLPADYEVTIIDAAGSNQEKIQKVSLEDLDRSFTISNLTSIYVPPAPTELLNHTFPKLRNVIQTLRGPEGCPWDKKQTHESLREYAMEEVYELIEAIEREDDEGIVEELGDILLQVMLHSQIGEDNGFFSVDDVIRSITEKMIHRHPHVFKDVTADTADEVEKNWDLLKQEEKGKNRTSVLDGIPPQLPSLLKAYKLQKKAAKVGFDWEETSAVWGKLEEELSEVREAIAENQQEEIEKEFGDVLFVLTNLMKHYKINPEIALNRTNQKFITRFSYIEDKLKEKQKDINKVSLKEMDMLWDGAKERE
ncbi:nucleoside triphosphate pyrophosphohydrolase [Cerasibacillus terrae]|uniref:Nucleoside triphosphate pyrophosphohydrolase n=1 Tax=Cerasibacillus terrae TaxID=2498845 RepID=A0A5C8NQU2_9BACI|nr:nucleoside triphosphate pyrophosphohydrolase [Cerasibacillus terrae]TXL63450.1 nucleoside triphosphate pyrophosphohydrolase [Cerasibacillus terrae]